jgi:hypothetical protein
MDDFWRTEVLEIISSCDELNEPTAKTIGHTTLTVRIMNVSVYVEAYV